MDATCCDAEVRYPTDSNLLEDGSRLIDRLLDKFCARHKVNKPRTHRVEARHAFIALTKKKRKGKKLIDKTKLIRRVTFLGASAGMTSSVCRLLLGCMNSRR